LVHLRARYLETTIGRFISRDKLSVAQIDGEWSNYWIYANGNPINFIDPSGFVACSANFRYCYITGGLYEGAFIDVHHYFSSRNLAFELMDQHLHSAKGRPFYSFTLSLILKDIFPVSGTYYTNIPITIIDDTLKRIGLGIFLDFQFHVENMEGYIPWCWSHFPFGKHCSAFSNEDLPSNYLGFVTYVKFPQWSINDLVNNLSPGSKGEGSDEFPEEYLGTSAQAKLCRFKGICDLDNPFNRKCTFKIFDELSGKFINHPWPSHLTMSPIWSGEFWAKSISGFTTPIPTPEK
jgi:hypothetical protein